MRQHALVSNHCCPRYSHQHQSSATFLPHSPCHTMPRHASMSSLFHPHTRPTSSSLNQFPPSLSLRCTSISFHSFFLPLPSGHPLLLDQHCYKTNFFQAC